MLDRTCGILLHVTSLPGPHGTGDLGPAARRMAGFLASAGQGCWQVLPLNPAGKGNSPYSSTSAFAGHPLLISLEDLEEEGLLSAADLRRAPRLPSGRAAFREAARCKGRLLRRAFEAFRREGGDLEDFRRREGHWLDDHALFTALRARYGGRSWTRWPRPLKERVPAALDRARSELQEQVDFEVFLQSCFHGQWETLRAHCREAGVKVMGDLPFYVSLESADVWANAELFNLDDQGRPRTVAGVPPDYYSRSGQLWGNPIYRWDVMKRRGYRWWRRRLAHNLRLYDLLRVDHFRGFVGYWEVPSGARSARAGRWVVGPGERFFRSLSRHVPRLDIIAEDLGEITADVRETIRRLGFPGMRVLQFGFGKDAATSIHAPHNHEPHSVVYTGTHDNNTTRGWFEQELAESGRTRVFRYLGRRVSAARVPWEVVRLAYASVARLAVVPMQDLLGLGAEARMNRPAAARGNWTWRLEERRLTPALVRRLRELAEDFGRC